MALFMLNIPNNIEFNDDDNYVFFSFVCTRPFVLITKLYYLLLTLKVI